MPQVEIDTTGIEKGLTELMKRFGSKQVVNQMEVIADELLSRAEDSPIPSDTRQLALSATVHADDRKKEVVFGFNKVYAAFQDQPGRTGVVVIKPRRKKFLYVPLNQRGRKHRLGNKPSDEGLTWGVDYVLKKEVRIKIKGYGSALGPNHYFSETIKRNVNWALEALAKRLERLMGGQGAR